MGGMTASASQVALREIDGGNFEACASINVAREQSRFTNAPHWSMLQQFYAPHRAGSRQLAIYIGDEVAGMVCLGFGNEFSPDWFMLEEIVIDVRFQRRGVAFDALSLALEMFRADGRFGVVRAFTDSENTAAIKLCEKLWFTLTDDAENLGRVNGEYIL